MPLPPSPPPGEHLSRPSPLPFVLPWPTEGPAANRAHSLGSPPLPPGDIRHRLQQQKTGMPRVKLEGAVPGAAAPRMGAGTAIKPNERRCRHDDVGARASTVSRDGRGGRSNVGGSGGGGVRGGSSSAPPVDRTASLLAGLKQQSRTPQPDEALHDVKPGRLHLSLASMLDGGRADKAWGRQPGATAEPTSTHGWSTRAPSVKGSMSGSGKPPSSDSMASVTRHGDGLSSSGRGGLRGGSAGGAGGGQDDRLLVSRHGRDDGRGDCRDTGAGNSRCGKAAFDFVSLGRGDPLPPANRDRSGRGVVPRGGLSGGGIGRADMRDSTCQGRDDGGRDARRGAGDDKGAGKCRRGDYDELARGRGDSPPPTDGDLRRLLDLPMPSFRDGPSPRLGDRLGPRVSRDTGDGNGRGGKAAFDFVSLGRGDPLSPSNGDRSGRGAVRRGGLGGGSIGRADLRESIYRGHDDGRDASRGVGANHNLRGDPDVLSRGRAGARPLSDVDVRPAREPHVPRFRHEPDPRFSDRAAPRDGPHPLPRDGPPSPPRDGGRRCPPDGDGRSSAQPDRRDRREGPQQSATPQDDYHRGSRHVDAAGRDGGTVGGGERRRTSTGDARGAASLAGDRATPAGGGGSGGYPLGRRGRSAEPAADEAPPPVRRRLGADGRERYDPRAGGRWDPRDGSRSREPRDTPFNTGRGSPSAGGDGPARPRPGPTAPTAGPTPAQPNPPGGNRAPFRGTPPVGIPRGGHLSMAGTLPVGPPPVNIPSGGHLPMAGAPPVRTPPVGTPHGGHLFTVPPPPVGTPHGGPLPMMGTHPIGPFPYGPLPAAGGASATARSLAAAEAALAATEATLTTEETAIRAGRRTFVATAAAHVRRRKLNDAAAAALATEEAALVQRRIAHMRSGRPQSGESAAIKAEEARLAATRRAVVAEAAALTRGEAEVREGRRRLTTRNTLVTKRRRIADADRTALDAQRAELRAAEERTRVERKGGGLGGRAKMDGKGWGLL